MSPTATPTAIPIKDASLSTLESRAFRGGVSLVARQSITKGVGLVANIMLARLLSPTEFGIYACVVCWMQFFNLTGDLGFGASLVRQVEEPTAEQESTVFFAQLALFSLPSLLVVALAPICVATFKLPPDVVWLIRLMSLSGVIACFKTIPSARLERALKFDKLARVDVLESIVWNVSVVSLAFAGKGVWSFAIASLVSQIASVALLKLIEPWRVRMICSVAIIRERLRFGAQLQGSTVASFIKDSFTPFFIGNVCGAAAVGLVNFANTVATYPTWFAALFGRIYYSLFSRAQHDPDRLREIVHSCLWWNNVAVLGLTSILLPLTDVSVPIVFGQKWSSAVPLIYLFAVVNPFTATVWPLLALCNAMGRTDVSLKYSLLQMFGPWIIALPLTKIFGPIGFAYGCVIMQSINLYVFVKAKRMFGLSLFKPIVPVLSAASLNALVIFIASRLLPVNSSMSVVLFCVCGCASFALLTDSFSKHRLTRSAKSLVVLLLRNGPVEDAI